MAEPTPPSLPPPTPPPASNPPTSPLVRSVQGPTRGLRTKALADALGDRLEANLLVKVREMFREVGLDPVKGRSGGVARDVHNAAAKSLRWNLLHGTLFDDSAEDGNRGAGEGGAAGGGGEAGG